MRRLILTGLCALALTAVAGPREDGLFKVIRDLKAAAKIDTITIVPRADLFARLFFDRISGVFYTLKGIN